MNHRSLPSLLLLGVSAWLGSPVAIGQVVQLPSVRNFSYTGAVSVPDAGTASLAGNSSSVSSSVGRGWGPYSAGAGGRSSSASSLALSVQIIDLQAMDDAILSSNVSRNSSRRSGLSAGSPAAGGGRRYLAGLNSSASSENSVVQRDPNEWARALAGHNGPASTALSESQAESDIRYYLRQGKAAERAGRILAARVYYRMAVEAMSPEMQGRYLAILAERKEKKESDSSDENGKQPPTVSPQTSRIRF